MNAHFVSIIALDESDLPELENGKNFNPKQLGQHFDWKSIGLLSKPLEARLKHTHPAFLKEFESSLLEVKWIPSLGRVVVIISKTDTGNVIERDLGLPEYWLDSEASIRRDWSAIMSQHNLPDVDWVFSFVIFEVEDGEHLKIDNYTNETKSKNPSRQSAGLSAIVDWNGALIVNEPKNSNTCNETIIGIVAIIAIQWQVDLMAIKTMRVILSQDGDQKEQCKETFQVARLARRANLSHVKLLSIYVNNHLIPKIFIESWAMNELKEQVNSTIQRIATLNEIESNMHSRASNSKQEKLLFLISLTGVSGTMAAVIATVDFKNAFISSESWRFILVACSAVSIALLAYLNKKNSS